MTALIPLLLIVLFVWAVMAIPALGPMDWAPGRAPLMTRWANDVDPKNPLPDYPRPQMVRDDWTNLNGLWHYAVTDDATKPDQWAGQILVPFCIESALSGVMQRIEPTQTLWYRRAIERPTNLGSQRLLLHFGAVDHHATVYVNGTPVGEHTGGYDGFSFDITEHLTADANELIVQVADPTDTASQPVGKQVTEPGGIWYTPVTGIWQTVWLEVVPAVYIERVELTPDVDASTVRIGVEVGGKGDAVQVRVTTDGQTTTPDAPTFTLTVDDPQLWSPADPHLYDVKIELLVGGSVVDSVDTYFAMRSVEIKPDANGHKRIHLNGAPIFSFGLLDQGYWPDGLYTAPTDAALRYDLEMTRAWGFNTVRKHVKVEPARWYWHCDRMGLLVWQDMPNIRHPTPPWVQDVSRLGPEAEMPSGAARQFAREMSQMVFELKHFPSIIMWVPFNESWGQHDTVATVDELRSVDPTRLINAASGGNFFQVGDVLDIHNYPNPISPGLDQNMTAVCGEFGGLGWPVNGHNWSGENNWGYRTYQTQAELNDSYHERLTMLPVLISQGLAAAIYTQTTDVEVETNGLMTYDRAIIKISPEDATALAEKLYATPATVEKIMPDARDGEFKWQHTTEQPAFGWNAVDFDDSAWQQNPGSFGADEETQHRTDWVTDAIWLRRTFELADIAGDFYLTLSHKRGVDVYVNGMLAYADPGHTQGYGIHPISAEARAALRKGTNIIAIECRQNTHGQYIDAGVLRLVP